MSPFISHVWDTLCRNMPQLSTGHEDRLLPDSWTKDPSLPPSAKRKVLGAGFSFVIPVIPLRRRRIGVILSVVPA